MLAILHNVVGHNKMFFQLQQGPGLYILIHKFKVPGFLIQQVCEINQASPTETPTSVISGIMPPVHSGLI
jgi:hypothetical protein